MILHHYHDGSVGPEWQVGDYVRVRPLNSKEKADKYNPRRSVAGMIGRVIHSNARRPLTETDYYQFRQITLEMPFNLFQGQPTVVAFDLLPLNKMRVVAAKSGPE